MLKIMQLHINKRNRLRMLMLRLDSMCLSAEIVSVIAHFAYWSNNEVVIGNGKTDSTRGCSALDTRNVG